MSKRGGGKGGLLKDLRKQVAILEDDLRARTDSVEEYRVRLEEEHQRATEAERTAAPYEAWRDERVTQVAVAWVLACVFVRFCEDNGLIEHHWIAGAGDGLREAEERHEEFFRANPEMNDRDWLIKSFERLAGTNPTVAGLFDKAHNPLWELRPSYEAASELLKFWRRVDENGSVVHGFLTADLNTRFLGDLYQDLSESARKTYALLQTPEFVEDFVLNRTLVPALNEFGLTPVTRIRRPDRRVQELRPGLRTIDPACGSGHFLLGLFERLLAAWRKQDTDDTDEWALIRRALESVHGCDKNPFAVAIARFRLMVAALKEAKEHGRAIVRLDSAPAFPLNVAVGDSLLHGRDVGGVTDDDLFTQLRPETFYYRSEDIEGFIERCDLLGRRSYHVVVGNPPYITVNDKQENENYRNLYFACSGAYALSVPFAQRIFELAIRGDGRERAEAGFTGQITANSFMKRNFGKILIESFFNGSTYQDRAAKRLRDHPGIELNEVIDSSGAYIPGHGTPTVILVGRNRTAYQEAPVRLLLGIRGEPTQPELPEDGLVWSAIEGQVDRPGSESEWASCIDSDRKRIARFPWSLSGGGGVDLLSRLEKDNPTLRSKMHDSGRTTHTGLDDAFYIPEATTRTHGLTEITTPVVLGGHTRDFHLEAPTWTLFPYEKNSGTPRILEPIEYRFFWPRRTVLRERLDFGETPENRGLRWFDHSMFFPRRYRALLSLAFAFVATHNNFVLDRGGKVFNRSAPVIKLPEGASEDEHLALLAVLNSSAACFWLKQVCHDKGSQSGTGGFMHDEWERFYEFTGTKLQDFPLPADLPLPLGRALDALTQQLAAHEPSAICATDTSADRSDTSAPSRDLLDTGCTAWAETREQMIALQEELDWEVYHSYGLLSDADETRLTTPSPAEPSARDHHPVPRVKLGERAFEIVLARNLAEGKAETVWFERHRSTPTTEIPARWPAWYRDIVQARIDVIEKRKDIALIERPECKRRWATDPWDKKEKAALRTWLLDRCEDRTLWFHTRNGLEQPRTLTVGQLADVLSRQPDAGDIAQVAALYATHLGKPHLSLEQVLLDATDAEHVPFLAAYRYKETGLRKRAQWEDVWDLQRDEDRTGEQLKIPIPPKYTSGDFSKQSYWSNRGKLDVPKERFVSYPDAAPDNDPTLLLGWAGWDQRDQALALLDVVQERRRRFDWQADRLIPLLAGLAELMPWLKQWFGEVDEEWGDESAAEEIQGFLDGEMARLEIGPADLAGWRPAKGRRGRKPAGRRPVPPAAEAAQPALGADDDDGDEG